MKKVLLVICILSTSSLAWAQATAPSLGTAATFAVLGSAVTCTGPGVISGDVGATGAFTNTPVCTIAGGTPPATDTAATLAQTALTTVYQNALAANSSCTLPLLPAVPPASFTLMPGVYCSTAALTLTNITLTLDAGGNANAVWVIKIGAGLTGTEFQVVMANGGQPCNVYWLVGADSTLTTSTFQGNILAGGPTGSFTSTGGTLIGRVLANGAVTLTGPNIHGTCALAAQGGAGCKNDDDNRDEDKDHDRGDDHDRNHRDKDKDRDHKDKDHRDDD
jgi:Ice-binding-like